MEEEHIEEATQPGQYLAYEREKKGFTIEEIARELHLSPHIIRALEEEAHDKLPELVYVRGYIRSYCRLLSIDPIPVLDMYTENLPKTENQLLEDLLPSSPVNERQQQLIMIWGSVAVVSIFLVLIISWWEENQPVAISINEPSVVQEDTATQSNAKDMGITGTPPKQETIQPSPSIETVPAGSITSPLIEPTEVEIKEVAREGDAPDEGNHSDKFDTEEAVQKNDPVNESSPDVSASQTLNDSNFNTGNQRSDAIDDISQPVTLVVMSSGESWVRVRDGSGDVFIHRTLPADYNKIFMVKLPLKFELGNAYQVSIMIEGKDYDFSSYIRPNKVATFEITEGP